jgi:ATP/maltotriose-dependent transcriptional regulator MalT
MAQVTLDSGYRLESYTDGWYVQKKRIVEKGERVGAVAWDTLTYHGTLPAAIRALLERELRSSEATSLAELKQVQNRFMAWVKAQLGGPLTPREAIVLGSVTWEEFHGEGPHT